jgi:hypothetical protein
VLEGEQRAPRTDEAKPPSPCDRLGILRTATEFYVSSEQTWRRKEEDFRVTDHNARSGASGNTPGNTLSCKRPSYGEQNHESRQEQPHCSSQSSVSGLQHCFCLTSLSSKTSHPFLRFAIYFTAPRRFKKEIIDEQAQG